MQNSERLKVKMLFDRHVHFRWADLMQAIIAYTFKQCSGGIWMPNTIPIINSINLARRYGREINILSHKEEIQFAPYGTCYLTDNTDTNELKRGFEEGVWIAGKFYPKGTTTNSENGVTDIENIYHVFEVMQGIRMPALFHCEVPLSSGVDFFDRERVFVDEVLSKIKEEFPELKIVIEHASTKQAIEFVIRNRNAYATITPHHIMKNYNAMFSGNRMRLENFCLTPLNREEDRLALIRAITSDTEEVRKKFGGGTDTAAHYWATDKLIDGKPGIFTAPFATELYVQVFEQENALKYIDDFLAVNLLEEVYDISPNDRMYTTLIKKEWEVPQEYNGIRPFMAGEKLQWKMFDQLGR